MIQRRDAPPGPADRDVLHPELVTSGIYAWDELPDVLTAERPGHKPIFVLES